MSPFHYHEGRTPLLISMPHAGTFVPARMFDGMTERAQLLPDTDWHVDRLYDFAGDLGASLLTGTHSRYVIDLNRPPDDRPLYPGADNSALCPTTLFDRSPVYVHGHEPDTTEIERRLATIWRPYHDQLSKVLRQTVRRYGVALLYEAHTIRSRVPRFFEGRLSDLNLGTVHGRSSAPELEARLFAVCRSARNYTSVLNGRFIGGYITRHYGRTLHTRHYGRPRHKTHVVQLELSQITYMDEAPPFRFDEARADQIRAVLRELVEVMLDWGSR